MKRLLVLLTSLAALAFAGADSAQAQYNYLLSGPTAVLSNAWVCDGVAGAVPAAVTNSAGVPLKLGQGVSIMTWYTTGQATSTYPMTIYWSVSPDGTTWTEDTGFFSTFLARGTTNSYSWTNISLDVVGNARWIKPYRLSQVNTTNAFSISNIYVIQRY